MVVLCVLQYVFSLSIAEEGLGIDWVLFNTGAKSILFISMLVPNSRLLKLLPEEKKSQNQYYYDYFYDWAIGYIIKL